MLQLAIKLYYKLCKPKSLWHMRHYSFDYDIVWGHKNLDQKNTQQNNDTIKIKNLILYTSNILTLKTQQTSPNLAIIASGPSAKNTDWNKLQTYDIAFVNGAIRLHPQSLYHDHSTRFFLVTDPNFIKTNFLQIKDIILENIVCIFSVRAFYEISKHHKDFLMQKQKDIYILDQLHEPFKAPKFQNKDFIESADFIFDSEAQIGFSKNASKGIFNGKTVVYSMLQIAAFLDYKNIEIYGMDLNGSQRFYKEEKNKAPSYIDHDYAKTILPSMLLAKKYFDKNKVEIKNMSPISKLKL